MAACRGRLRPTVERPPSGSASTTGGPVAEQTGLAVDALSFTFLRRPRDGSSFQPSGTGRLRTVQTPFTHAGSGQPVSVASTQFVELHLAGMLLTDAAGVPIYVGLASAQPDMVALRQVEQTDASEGVYDFLIGYVGPGCVTLTDDAATRTLTVSIRH